MPQKKYMVVGLMFVFCLMAESAFSQNWANLGEGLGDDVESIALGTNGELYAGGSFTNAGGVAANHIARWNGSTWTNLGGGIGSFVYSLAVNTNDEVYAGGNFATADGLTRKYITKWTGSTWTNVGSGMSNYISALALNTNGELYAGGSFTGAGGVAANYIAKWTGSAWTNLGAGMNAAVYALAVASNGDLYAGGAFTNAGGVAAVRIARWNGSIWTNLGGGLSNTVYAFAFGTNGDLYAGGSFTNAGGVAANRIAKWNGSAWTNLGIGVDNNYVSALAFGSNGRLYAGGLFTNSCGVGANYIAAWNGSTWTNLGSGMNDGVKELAVDADGRVYAGGYFTNAGGVAANYVAEWAATVMRILGTNNAVICSGDAASSEKGSDFGARAVGAIVTNVFSITNAGQVSLQITGVTTGGSGAARFTVNGMPALVSGNSASNFAVTFNAAAGGIYTAVVAIANDSTNTPYLLNLRGISGGEIGLSVTNLAFTAVYHGANPAAQAFVIMNLNQAGYDFTNIVRYGSGASGWLNVMPASGSVAGGGMQAEACSVNMGGLDAGAYAATNAVTSANAWNSPQNLTVTLTISKAGQTIAFPAVADQVTTNIVGLSATASSGLAVGFSVLSGQAQISGGTNLSFSGAGSVSIVAGQAGDNNRNAAPAVTNVFTAHAAASTPRNVAASSGTSVDKVTVTWSAADEAGGYQVWRHTANDSSAATLIGATAGLDYNDAGAAVGVPYYYWVKATNTYSTSAFSSSASGWRSDVSAGVCADYDGDHKADPAVYDEATGTWKVRLSGAGYYMINTTVNGLGGIGCASVAADYDGDGLADPAVYNEATGIWLIVPSSAGYAVVIALGQPLGGPGYSGMPADYDGDGKADPGVYQRENGDWQVMLSSANYYKIEKLGLLGGIGYRAVAADYDGDHKADPAICGESNGYWIFKLSGAGYIEIALSRSLGGTGHVPVPADYDGDGLADPAVIDSATGLWYIMYSSLGYDIVIKSWTF